MKHYKKYFNLIKDLFIDSYESAGGQEYRFIHSVNVANISVYIADKSNISIEDRDIVVISSIFHDIAKSLRVQADGFLDGSHSYERNKELLNHELQSADMVSEILADDLPREKINLIQKTITNHSHPKTLLEKVLHDADELSEMGSMNVWKMSTYSANKKRDVLETIKYWFEIDRPRHLTKMEGLFLGASRTEAARRIAVNDSLFNDLKNQLRME